MKHVGYYNVQLIDDICWIVFHIKSLFEIIPPSARDKYLFLKKKTFLFNMDLSDEEVIVPTETAKNILENKPRKKMQKKTSDESTVAKKVSIWGL